MGWSGKSGGVDLSAPPWVAFPVVAACATALDCGRSDGEVMGVSFGAVLIFGMLVSTGACGRVGVARVVGVFSHGAGHVLRSPPVSHSATPRTSTPSANPIANAA